MAHEEITVSEAIDRLITAFDARGWREDGETARAIAKAAAAGEAADARVLAQVVRPKFLVNNGIEREAVEVVIAHVLGGTTVIAAMPATGPIAASTSITVSNTGTIVGPIGGGVVSDVRVHHQQVMGDEAIHALVAQYAERPEVREIMASDLPVEEKRSRLTTVVNGLGNFASDTIAKIATGLLRHPDQCDAIPVSHAKFIPGMSAPCNLNLRLWDGFSQWTNRYEKLTVGAALALARETPVSRRPVHGTSIRRPRFA